MDKDIEKNEDLNQVSVGAEIRNLRKLRGISLQKMAEDTGMSYSYLSGLENDKHSVSITNLQKIAKFFKVNLVYFLTPKGPVPRVFRKKDLYDPNNAYGNIAYRVITPESSGCLQVSYAYLPPNAPKEQNVHKHGAGQELVLVLDGCSCIMVENEKYKIEQGDCIIFESSLEHVIYTEEQPATLVIVSSPPYGRNILPVSIEEKEVKHEI